MIAANWTKLLVTVAVIGMANLAEARLITATWDPNGDPNTIGYRIYVGTAPHTYITYFDVGNVTTYQFDAPDVPELYVVVRALGAGGVLSDPSNEAVVRISNQPPVLHLPSELVAPPGPISVQLPAHDPDGDRLSFSASGLPGTIKVHPSTGVVSGHLPSGSYNVTITVSDGIAVSQATFRLLVPGNQTQMCAAPPAPPTLQQAAVTGNQIGLRWSPSGGSQPTSYVLLAGSASGRSDIVVAELPASVTAIAPTAPNGVYFVRVAARNSCGVNVSNEIAVRVGPAPPAAPTLKFTRTGPTVTLSWTQPGPGIGAYVLEAGTHSGLANLAVYNTRSPATSQTFTLPAGRYYVRVRAVNGGGAGSPSNEIVIDIQ